MSFEKKIEIIQKVLFVNYELSEKININDWYDESVEISLLINKIKNKEKASDIINDYLIKKFKDDAFTDFNKISEKIITELY